MKALNVADDTQHVLTFAHICHKDALERRLLLVELPPNSSMSCLELLTSNSGAVRVCMTDFWNMGQTRVGGTYILELNCPNLSELVQCLVCSIALHE